MRSKIRKSPAMHIVALLAAITLLLREFGVFEMLKDWREDTRRRKAAQRIAKQKEEQPTYEYDWEERERNNS